MKRTNPTLRVLADLGRALWTQRRWWLLPVVLATLIVGAALLAGASPATPFVYTFF